MEKGRWQDWANAAFGIWLVASPWLLAYSDRAAAANSHLTGAAVAVLALFAVFTGRTWEEWGILGLAVWLLVAPFLLGFPADPVALWNHLILGLLIGADSLWSMQRRDPAAV